MRVKMILPALQEAESPYWRPIKYSLFPPLGLATLAAYFRDDDEVEIVDQHVEKLTLDDEPDLVCIQVYVTNAYRAYRIADHYRQKGVYVAMGGLHVTSLPDEAALHADTILLGPGEEAFPRFVNDLREGHPQKRYVARWRSIENIPPVRRDLIKREKYFVPNSLVVSRGCPHHCDFCYKDAFYGEGKSFYTQRVDEALAELTGFMPNDKLIHLERVRLFDGKALIRDKSYFLESALPGLTPRIAEDSLYEYAEETLGMRIVTSNRTVTMEYALADDRAVMDLLDFDMLAVVTNHTFNEQGVMFETTQSRHRPDFFTFHDTAVRGY